jgi:hypothetical protein
VAVGQAHLALRGFADVRNDLSAFDGVAANQVCNGRIDGRLVVYKMAQAFVLKKRNAPAIGMVVGAPAALGKATETEHHIRGHIAIHSQQLAHSRASSLDVSRFRSLSQGALDSSKHF